MPVDIDPVISIGSYGISSYVYILAFHTYSIPYGIVQGVVADRDEGRAAPEGDGILIFKELVFANCYIIPCTPSDALAVDKTGGIVMGDDGIAARGHVNGRLITGRIRAQP